MKYLTENKHWGFNKDYNVDKILYLLIDRPDYDYSGHCFEWGTEEKPNRNYDLPSKAYLQGDILWFKLGIFHRDKSKPAAILSSGYIEYYINGDYRGSDFCK